MTEKYWHYVDQNQQKIGPVTADAIREASRRGELRPDTLVWNADLPQWQSLASHAAVLGIDISQANRPMLNGRAIAYANFFHRWAAHMMDQWLVSATALAIVGLVATASYFGMGISFEKDPQTATFFMVSVVFAYIFFYVCISGIYNVHYETSSHGGSLGKQYLGLEVKTETGETLDTKTAILRWFSILLSHLSQSIGFLIAAFTPKRQALHDFVAHTLVLERENSIDVPPVNRNKRAIIILVAGIVVMPIVITAAMIAPVFYFINQQEQVRLEQNRRIAKLVAPVQQAISEHFAAEQICLTDGDAEIRTLLKPLKPLTSEIYVGSGEDGETCEIYLTWDGYKTVDYNYSEPGGWTCTATHTPEHFGENCQIIDY